MLYVCVSYIVICIYSAMPLRKDMDHPFDLVYISMLKVASTL
jgi:hypothetical protein